MTRIRFVTPLIALALLITACPAGNTGGTPAGSPGGSGAAGATITVTSLWGGSEQENFQKVLDAFKAQTGITAKFESQRTTYAQVLRTKVQGGNPPDVAIMPNIGFLRSFARDGSLKKLSDLGIDVNALKNNYAAGVLDVGTVDGNLYGIEVKGNSKSVVWYRPDIFKAKGYTVPKTWDELIALANKIKADGLVPFSVGAGGSGPDSWTLTDWFESIYLRQAGTDAYNKLFSKDGNWTDPTVKTAVQTMLQVINDRYVLGGINGALSKGFVDGIGDVFGPNPKAVMYYEGGFVGGLATGQVNKNLKIGTEIDWFPFPSFPATQGTPVEFAGDVIAAFTTKPGVKEFITYMTTQQSGETWAKTGAIISPVKSVPVSVYPNDLAKKEAEQVASASAVVYDGSDLLPAGVDLGAALQGIVKTPTNVDGALDAFNKQASSGWANEK